MAVLSVEKNWISFVEGCEQMNLTEHFTLEEFTFSETAVRHGIANDPSDEEIDKLRWLATQFEDVRTITGALHCNSVFRCLQLNRAIGSSDNSQHVKCEAGDLRSLTGLTPLKLCQLVVASSLRFDQVIYEYNSWMHVSFVQNRPPRKMVLTINKQFPRGTPGLVE